jgi:hypothetical protein
MTMADRSDASLKRAEIGARHGNGDARVARRGEEGDRAAAGVPRDGDAVWVYVFVCERPIDQAGYVPDTLADGRPPDKQTAHELHATGLNRDFPDDRRKTNLVGLDPF